MHDANIEHPFKIWIQATYDWNIMKRIKTRNPHDWETRKVKKKKKIGKSANKEITKNLGLILCDPESLLT